MASNDNICGVEQHIRSMAELIPIRELQEKALLYVREREFHKAVEVCTDIVENLRVNLGPNHERTLKVQTIIGKLHIYMNNNEEAFKILTQVYDTNLHLYGSKDTKTEEIMKVLSIVLKNDGKYCELRKFYSGSRQDDVLICEFADYLMREGALEASLKFYKNVYEMRLKMFGKNHEQTQKSIRTIADVLAKLGRYEEIVKLYRGLTKELKHKIADDLKKEGKLVAAMMFYKGIFRKRLESFGNHKETEDCVRSIAGIFKKHKMYYEACQIYYALKDGFIYQTAITEDLCQRGEFNLALKIYKERYEKDAKKWGIDDPDRTLYQKESIARMYRNLGRTEECLQVYVEVLQSRNKSLVQFHEVAKNTVEDFVDVFVRTDNADKWLDFLRKHQYDVSCILGLYHYHTIWVLYCYGYALAYRRQYSEALGIYSKVSEKLSIKYPQSLKALRSNFPIICMHILLCDLKNATEFAEKLFDGLSCLLEKTYYGLKNDILLCYKMKQILNNCIAIREMKLGDFHYELIGMIINQKTFFMNETHEAQYC